MGRNASGRIAFSSTRAEAGVGPTMGIGTPLETRLPGLVHGKAALAAARLPAHSVTAPRQRLAATVQIVGVPTASSCTTMWPQLAKVAKAVEWARLMGRRRRGADMVQSVGAQIVVLGTPNKLFRPKLVVWCYLRHGRPILDLQ